MTLAELYLIRMILIDELTEATDLAQPEACLSANELHELIMELATVNALIADFERSIQMQEQEGVWIIVTHLD